jgi:hypothetical protein
VITQLDNIEGPPTPKFGSARNFSIRRHVLDLATANAQDGFGFFDPATFMLHHD